MDTVRQQVAQHWEEFGADTPLEKMEALIFFDACFDTLEEGDELNNIIFELRNQIQREIDS